MVCLTLCQVSVQLGDDFGVLQPGAIRRQRDLLGCSSCACMYTDGLCEQHCISVGHTFISNATHMSTAQSCETQWLSESSCNVKAEASRPAENWSMANAGRQGTCPAVPVKFTSGNASKADCRVVKRMVIALCLSRCCKVDNCPGHYNLWIGA